MWAILVGEGNCKNTYLDYDYIPSNIFTPEICPGVCYLVDKWASGRNILSKSLHVSIAVPWNDNPNRVRSCQTWTPPFVKAKPESSQIHSPPCYHVRWSKTSISPIYLAAQLAWRSFPASFYSPHWTRAYFNAS